MVGRSKWAKLNLFSSKSKNSKNKSSLSVNQASDLFFTPTIQEEPDGESFEEETFNLTANKDYLVYKAEVEYNCNSAGGEKIILDEACLQQLLELNRHMTNIIGNISKDVEKVERNKMEMVMARPPPTATSSADFRNDVAVETIERNNVEAVMASPPPPVGEKTSADSIKDISVEKMDRRKEETVMAKPPPVKEEKKRTCADFCVDITIETIERNKVEMVKATPTVSVKEKSRTSSAASIKDISVEKMERNKVEMVMASPPPVGEQRRTSCADFGRDISVEKMERSKAEMVMASLPPMGEQKRSSVDSRKDISVQMEKSKAEMAMTSRPPVGEQKSRSSADSRKDVSIQIEKSNAGMVMASRPPVGEQKRSSGDSRRDISVEKMDRSNAEMVMASRPPVGEQKRRSSDSRRDISVEKMERSNAEMVMASRPPVGEQKSRSSADSRKDVSIQMEKSNAGMVMASRPPVGEQKSRSSADSRREISVEKMDRSNAEMVMASRPPVGEQKSRSSADSRKDVSVQMEKSNAGMVMASRPPVGEQKRRSSADSRRDISVEKMERSNAGMVMASRPPVGEQKRRSSADSRRDISVETMERSNAEMVMASRPPVGEQKRRSSADSRRDISVEKMERSNAEMVMASRPPVGEQRRSSADSRRDISVETMERTNAGMVMASPHPVREENQRNSADFSEEIAVEEMDRNNVEMVMASPPPVTKEKTRSSSDYIEETSLESINSIDASKLKESLNSFESKRSTRDFSSNAVRSFAPGEQKGRLGIKQSTVDPVERSSRDGTSITITDKSVEIIENHTSDSEINEDKHLSKISKKDNSFKKMNEEDKNCKGLQMEGEIILDLDISTSCKAEDDVCAEIYIRFNSCCCGLSNSNCHKISIDPSQKSFNKLTQDETTSETPQPNESAGEGSVLTKWESDIKISKPVSNISILDEGKNVDNSQEWNMLPSGKLDDKIIDSQLKLKSSSQQSNMSNRSIKHGAKSGTNASNKFAGSNTDEAISLNSVEVVSHSQESNKSVLGNDKIVDSQLKLKSSSQQSNMSNRSIKHGAKSGSNASNKFAGSNTDEAISLNSVEVVSHSQESNKSVLGNDKIVDSQLKLKSSSQQSNMSNRSIKHGAKSGSNASNTLAGSNTDEAISLNGVEIVSHSQESNKSVLGSLRTERASEKSINSKNESSKPIAETNASGSVKTGSGQSLKTFNKEITPRKLEEKEEEIIQDEKSSLRSKKSALSDVENGGAEESPMKMKPTISKPGEKTDDAKPKPKVTIPETKPSIPIDRKHRPPRNCDSMEIDVTKQFTTLRKTGIDHPNPEVKRKLNKLGVDYLLKASRPAKCCRRAILNEAQRDSLPFSVSLQSLPLEPSDIEVIKESLKFKC